VSSLLWTLALVGWVLAAVLVAALSLWMFLGAAPRQDKPKKKPDR